VHIGHFLIRQ